MRERIVLDDPLYNGNQTTTEKKTKKKRLYTIAGICWAVIMISGFAYAGYQEHQMKSLAQTNQQNLHKNCLFLGYADPNRGAVTGSTILSREPQYGFRPVYTDPNDLYNSYHFH